MDIAPDGTVKVFAQIDAAKLPGPCPGGVGLTTALVVLRSGWVVVGSLPTTAGMADTATAGCLLVLNKNGKVVEDSVGVAARGGDQPTVGHDGIRQGWCRRWRHGRAHRSGRW
jgi:hypothetical protein